VRILSGFLAALLLLTILSSGASACGGMDCSSGKSAFSPPAGCGVSREGAADSATVGKNCCCAERADGCRCAERNPPSSTLRVQQNDLRLRPVAPAPVFAAPHPLCTVALLSATPATLSGIWRSPGTPGYLRHQSLLL
jgi:hypothetical protein